MTKYKVIRQFSDKPHDHTYSVGDEYPLKGKKATKQRLEVLSTTKNAYKKVYIEAVTPAKED